MNRFATWIFLAVVTAICFGAGWASLDTALASIYFSGLGLYVHRILN